MFLVDDILAAPGKAMLFLFRELAKKAKDDFLDDETVKQQLQEIYTLLDSGSISGEEFESREMQLLKRLEQIARIKSGETETLALPPPADDAPTAELLRDQDNLDRVMRWREQQHAAAPVIERGVAVSPLLPLTPSAQDALPIPPPSLPTPPSFAAPPSFAPAPSFAAPPPSFATAPSFAPPPSLAAPPAFVAPPSPAPTAVSSDGYAAPAVSQMTMGQVIDSVFRSLATMKLKVSSVTSVSRDEAGWRVTAEVVERRAVPDSGDLLGIYDLRLDDAGSILRYERTRMRRRSDLGR